MSQPNLYEMSKTKPNIIVAFTDKNKIIANDKQFVWPKLDMDRQFLSYFLKENKDAILIMGRITWEVCKMTKRNKIIVTSQKPNEKDIDEFTEFASSYEEAIKLAGNNKIIIFGGQEIYRKALQGSFKLFCTVIEEQDGMKGNVIFPIENSVLENKIDITEDLFRKFKKENVEFKDGFIIEKNIKMSFYIVDQ